MPPAPPLARILAHLEALVAFPTVSSESNLELIAHVRAHLAACGFAVTEIAAAGAPKAGLLARIGPQGGVLLSAHSDVVPVAGQSWSLAPFALTRRGGRVHGRGTTDMKGFLAVVLALAEGFRATPPARGVALALSWDEEVGCRGIAELAPHVTRVLGRPDLVIVGEPSRMRPARAHKGKVSYRATARGEAGHSASAPAFRNALHPAAELILAIRAEQAHLSAAGAQDPSQVPPSSTIHAGVMRGGSALNIVPDSAEVLFEIRHLAEETPEEILERMLARLAPEARAALAVEETGRYPGLAADLAHPAFAPLLAALPDPRPTAIAFGTEAGAFAALGLPTVVCGPGTMDDGHQPDESIEVAELALCGAVLARLVGAQPG